MKPRTPRQAEASRANGRRSEGPRTAEGKARSASNAVRHGLRAEQRLLPGESLDAYLAHLAGWCEGLGATSPAEAEVVARLADVGWRLRRLVAAEHQAHLEALATAVAESPEARRHGAVQQALGGARGLLAAVASRPPPGQVAGLDGLLPCALEVARRVVQVDDEVKLTAGLAERLARTLNTLREVWALETVLATGRGGDAAEAEVAPPWAAPYLALRQVLPEVCSALEAREAQLRADVAEREVALAREVLPDGPAWGRLRRARADLERTEAHLLEVLGRMRTLRAASGASGSFGEPSEAPAPVELKLTVVK